MPSNPRDYALVIGIKDYPNYNSLVRPIEDANAFESWLLAEDGGGLEVDHCKTVRSVRNPLEPTHEQIDRALNEIIRMSRNGDARRFYLFFSGHGLGCEPDDTGLCLAGWAMDWMGLALSSREYLNFLVNSGRFKEVFFFLDCCQIHMTHRAFHAPYLTNPGPAENASDVRTFVGCAAEYNRSAFEGANGFFTQALLQGLQGHATSSGPGVTPHELHQYLTTHTRRIADEAGFTQEARCMNGFDADNAPVLGAAAPLALATVNVRFTFSVGVNVQLQNADGEELRSGNVQDGEHWSLQLAPNIYAFIRTDSGVEKLIRVTAHKTDYHVEWP